MGDFQIMHTLAAYDRAGVLAHTDECPKDPMRLLEGECAVESYSMTGAGATYYLPSSNFLREECAQQGVQFTKETILSSHLLADVRKAQQTALQVLEDARKHPVRSHDDKPRLD